MNSFIHEGGKGNMLDDQGNAVFAVDMKVDDEAYPLENIANLNQYLDGKPPKKMEQEKEEELLKKSNDNQLSKKKRTYRSCQSKDNG
ncbi:hypothetical protein G6F46_000672 [Rhizopus delemar]|uniref:Uncharacterized protein n=2 Tax=Rhizopus TaxID=4842 RepID=A0A9P7CT42_9FUNG|nr:hypothetical protein G6F36_011554 [Rhizopus arrhizus]KAG1461910.1 hypothetical protein G6F55_003296 [Rhizopus delemar]KAG1527929.1 hypothetical protein G6F52_001096 [Rhizopus delemar]KAG1554087.1 hypothetical protein G6F51_000183 [Rhizopus arrhizus]KAG1560347.1 hypothetical protein G6F49_002774 [Rhizopus delemar]